MAQARGLRVGSCARSEAIENDGHYARVLAGEFDIITTENALKLEYLCPRRGEYDFSAADALVHFAKWREMDVRGHPLIWHLQLPDWLQGRHTRGELSDFLVSHVMRVTERYAGRVAVWDVVNEAVAEDGTLRDTVWSKVIGPQYIELAFRAARAVDPDALLFYNDFGTESSAAHGNGVYDLVRRLLDAGVPLDGVGLQMHLKLEALPDPSTLTYCLQRFGQLPIQVHVTELDIRMDINGVPTMTQLERQADAYAEIMRVCLAAENCTVLGLWGFTDRHSWIPAAYPGEAAALLFDTAYGPKPAYDALLRELEHEVPARNRSNEKHRPGR